MINISEIQNQWENFIKNNEIPKNIRPDILSSWLRCKEYKIDTNNGEGKKIPKGEFEKILNEKKELIQIAIPAMIDLYKIVEATNYSIVLTDENAVVIEVIGNQQIMKKNQKLNFLRGCRWKEEDVGTNAIGTSLYLNKPIQTLAAEHYCKQQHRWTCSAAPIHDSKGNIIGIIDLSGDFYDYQLHTLGIVVETAKTIEKQFAIVEHKKWVDVVFNSIEGGILVIDKDFTVKDFNSKMCEMLRITEDEVYKLDIKLLLKDILNDINNFSSHSKISYREVNLYLKNYKVECNINVSPVKIENRYTNFVIFAKKIDSIRNVVRRIAGFSSIYSFDSIITNNPKMLYVIDEAKRIAQNECSILITGESGTGKELFSHSIHNASKRCNGPFLAINCAALPKDLVESELFGYEKFAFTGASKEGKPGKFELANNGTIFLDEIGELPLEVQSKLLRVLDNHSVTRIGGNTERKLDVRVIAATNRNLQDEIKNKNFRGDLYYRINVFNIELIPLRERTEDIGLCAEYFLQKLNHKNPEMKKHFDKDFISSLKNYSWPGNVRELENVIQRAYYLSKGESINYSFIPQYINDNIKHTVSINKEDIDKENIDKPLTLEELEKNLIIDALKYCDGNVVDASKLIGVGKSTLYRKVEKYKLKMFPKWEE